jgi:ribonuclease HI
MAKLNAELRRLAQAAVRLPQSEHQLAAILERLAKDKAGPAAFAEFMAGPEGDELRESLRHCAALLRYLEDNLSSEPTAKKERKSSRTIGSQEVKPTTKPQLPAGKAPRLVKVYFDGGSRGNPGPSACGVVFADEDDRVFWQANRKLGELTNNMAEYSGLVMALELALEHGWRRLRIFADSELIVKQMTGVYRVKHPDMKRMAARAAALIQQCESFKISHIPREQNALADKLVQLAVEEE